MSLLPERWSPRVRRHLLIAAATGSAVVVVAAGSDRLLAAVYEAWRPRLEALVGHAMGRPLRLGPYRGLGPDGLRIGPSRFLPGPEDASTARVEGLTVMPDLLAAWRDRTVALDLSFRGAEADLRRNAAGQIWVLGRFRPGAQPPRLDLRFHLLEPARLRLWGLGAGAAPLQLSALGDVGLRPHERTIEGKATVRLPGGSGAVVVEGRGFWHRRFWQATTALQRVDLVALAPLLPWSPPRSWRLAGHGDGRVTLTLREGVASCGGEVRLRQVQWRPAPGATPLRFERLPVRCQGRELVVSPSDWRYGDWRGSLAGRVDADRRIRAQARAVPPSAGPLGPDPLEAELDGLWRGGALQVARLDALRGSSRLRATGRVGGTLALDATWTLHPRDVPRGERLPTWLLQRPLEGTLRAVGPLTRPDLRLETGQTIAVLPGRWQAALHWQDGLLRLERFESRHLTGTASLPLAFVAGRGLVSGDLEARLRLRAYPLHHLDPVVGTRLRGEMDAEGSVVGPLRALRPDLALEVRSPAAGPLQLQESWRGRLQPDAADATGGFEGARLRLEALAPALPGTIDARLDRRWQPVSVALEREEGRLQLQGDLRGYRWTARRFPLPGLALAPGPGRPFQPLEGELSGSGSLGLQPLAFSGRVDLERPGFLGVVGRRILADVRYADRGYRITGSVEPLTAGRIDADVSGRWRGPFQARFRVRNLTNVLARQLIAAWPRWRGTLPPPRYRAADLGTLAIDTLGGSLQDQIQALQEAEARLAGPAREALQASRAARLARLQSRIDADLTLAGPDLRRARIDLQASGHLWMDEHDRDRALASEPFQLQLKGSLQNGGGSFDLSGLSLGLLSLLTPVPESLRGSLGASGRYRLGGARPDLAVDLSLQDAGLGPQDLALERGRVELREKGLVLDLSLRAAGASSSVDLAGTVPLDRTQEGLELRLASRGDGLRFLTALAGRALEWRQGSTDMQLLVRGSLAEPIANGFLRLREGECRFIGQTIRGIEARVLFDFEQLVVQELQARVGTRGRISGEGKLGLVRPLSAEQTLSVRFERVPFSLERIDAVSDGRLRFGGSLSAPEMGGELAISHGTVNVQPGRLAPAPARSAGAGVVPATAATEAAGVSRQRLLEEKWDLRQPLVLLGPDMDSSAGDALRAAVPQVSWLRFEGLRLRLGPDLRVVVPNVANFTTGGLLRIGGRLDSSLTIAGVVRLLGGRLNLFTTSFNLDPDSPNLAIFQPSLGLVPYLDIALRTRISDSLNVINPSGVGQGNSNATSLADLQNQGGFSSLNQLKLIQVIVSVQGPADRIGEILRLRSNPPLPQERLVALIGGNSLAGLSGAGAGAALATVLGQSLLSPLLTTLSDAFGQRLSLAFYPTYVNPSISTEQELRSGRVPPQLVLGSEIGLDITDRLNASVLAAPNRSDVPPQINLNYKASDAVNLEGSIDTQGSWQTQLRLFFRF